MRRIRIKTSYVGRQFYGWQFQSGLRTVQGELEKAVLTITDEKSRVTGAGRTDTGVHAIGQTAHFDSSTSLGDTDLLRAVNSKLPQDMTVLELFTENPSFHSTKSAKERQYVYRIEYSNGNPFTRGLVWQLKKRLCVENMKEALSGITGKHDFSSFCIAKSLKSNTFVDLRKAEIHEIRNGLLFFFAADRFLHKMLRSLVGMLYDIGRGKTATSQTALSLSLRSRKYGGFTAPADGLYLYRVIYSDEDRNFYAESFTNLFTGT
ncbi:tRNA pseudouridine(38-40) synthase TruA [candidate division WOR-3 bacterium]|nr:tRNA pseudouridine(38-40) synthase TruA [candidate division WOR-3 bacterium]